MLIRSTWTLTTDATITLPKSYGLDLVKVLHTQLKIEMGSEAIPSTTFAGLVGNCSTSREFVTFRPEEFYQLSLSGLQDTSSKAIADLDLGNQLQFLGATFTIVNREDETTSYEALYQKLVANEPEPVHAFDLRFITPTAFSQNRLYLPLPVPTLMFRSWLERWNHFAPVYLGGDELVGYLGDAIALSRHRIQTCSVQVYQKPITGFTGDASLRVLSRLDPLLANVAHLLVQYGQFSGTGIKPRLGMGCTTWS
ncbi:MAG: CRISPR system precrRNA processing endoribonuclease RAMP protein Cas6 [Kaiparowitsia implicata GSE-PSE-MK54-09C]|jgi:CRISPR-associated endoribonuclease Cas6|nr:CRISPR system precrRNA processing endoribonuclease RAMP protein Cas6 [Kaiparowitsia implicata GSE-PSE-MK54-09C]